MKILYSALLAAAGLLVLGSCTVYNKVHFNRDYSGTYEMQIDLESLLMMASAMDTTNSMDEGDLMQQINAEMDKDEMARELNTMDGISNAGVTIDKEKGFVIRFDFDDLPSLNNSFSEIQTKIGDMDSGMGAESQPVKHYDAFLRTGKTLTFRSPPRDTDEEDPFNLFGGGEGEGDEMLGQIGDFFEMKLEFTFDRKVKSVEATGIKILAQEKKRVLADVDMQEVVTDGGYEMHIRLR